MSTPETPGEEPTTRLLPALTAKLETGAITPEEADAIQEFAEFLGEAGPPPSATGHDPARYGDAVKRHREFLTGDGGGGPCPV